MSQESAAGNAPAQSTQEAVTPAPGAQAPEARSLPDQLKDFNARILAAKTPAEMRALIEEGKRSHGMREVTAADQKPIGEVAKPAEAAPAAAEEAAPASEETPAAEVADETETPPEPAPEETPAPADEDAEPEDTTVPTPSKAKKLRLSLREDDELGRLATEYQRRNRDWTLGQAMAAAQKQLGIKPDGTKASPETDTQPALPETPEAVDTAIKDLRAKKKQLLSELKFEEAEELDGKIDELRDHKSELKVQVERKQTEAVAKYHTGFNESVAKASDLYPDFGNPESTFAKRAKEIDADLEENGDPLFNAPDKPLKIAQMVARELSIAPKKKGAPAPAKPAAPATPAPAPAKPKGILPGGDSRTVAAVVPQKDATLAKIQSAPNTIQALRQLEKELGIRSL